MFFVFCQLVGCRWKQRFQNISRLQKQGHQLVRENAARAKVCTGAVSI
jgi:hypothetical protein